MSEEFKKKLAALSPRISGWPIIDRTIVDRTRDGQQGYVVVVDRGEKAGHRYVASLWFEGDSEWCQGYYCTTLEGARAKARELVRIYS